MAHEGSPFGSPLGARLFGTGSPADGFIHTGSPVRLVFGPFPDISGSPGIGGFNYGESVGSPLGTGGDDSSLNIIRNPHQGDFGGLTSQYGRTTQLNLDRTSAIVIFSKPRTIGYPSF